MVKEILSLLLAISLVYISAREYKKNHDKYTLIDLIVSIVMVIAAMIIVIGNFVTGDI